MKNIPDQGFEKAANGNFVISAILAHSGIVGDDDVLLMIDPNICKDFDDYCENIKILYEFGKIFGAKTGKGFVTWLDVLVDLDHLNQTGEVIILPKWKNLFLWEGGIVYCSPNKRIEM